MTKNVLGRGIEALISQDLRESVSETERVKDLDIERIDPNPHQPREHFDGEHLKELAESIRQNGVLQPIVVRRVENRYELILGERRKWVVIFSPLLVTVFILVVFSKFISIPFPKGIGVFAELSRYLF